MLPLRVLILLIAMLLSGCTATAIMIGEGEPDFEKIRLGDNRNKVEKILGQREWQLGDANGLSYEIYQFKAGRPPNPLLGTAAYAFDMITLGFLEVGYEPNQLAPVKQLSVGYDSNGYVRSVTKPWIVEKFGGCTRMRSAVPNDLGLPLAVRVAPTQQSAFSDIAPARLQLDRVVTLDGNSVGSSTVELHPGRHELSFHGYFPRRMGSFPVSLTFTSLPGQHYRLRIEEFWPYLMNFLIENTDSRETLDCVEVRADQLPGWLNSK